MGYFNAIALGGEAGAAGYAAVNHAADSRFIGIEGEMLFVAGDGGVEQLTRQHMGIGIGQEQQEMNARIQVRLD